MQGLDVPQLFVKQLCIVLQVKKKSPLKTIMYCSPGQKEIPPLKQCKYLVLLWIILFHKTKYRHY